MVELGTHDELYAMNGIYKDLVDMQMGNDLNSTPSAQNLLALVEAAAQTTSTRGEEKEGGVQGGGKGQFPQFEPGAPMVDTTKKLLTTAQGGVAGVTTSDGKTKTINDLGNPEKGSGVDPKDDRPRGPDGQVLPEGRSFIFIPCNPTLTHTHLHTHTHTHTHIHTYIHTRIHAHSPTHTHKHDNFSYGHIH